MRISGKLLLAFISITLLASVPMGCRTPQGETPAQKRAHARNMRDTAMKDLYKEKPGSKALVDRSVGYAAFSNIGTNFGFISTARGFGVLRDKSSGNDTYMEMLSLGGGVGLGIKDIRVFFIFLNPDTMKKFVENGLDFGGQAEGVATTEETEGIDLNATQNLDSVQANVVVLQLTEKGLAAQATLQGTRYTIDEELN